MKAPAREERRKEGVDLRGRPGKEVIEEIRRQVPQGQKRRLIFSYGAMARGEIEITHHRHDLRGKGFLPLTRPALPVKDVGLWVKVTPRGPTGYLAFRTEKGVHNLRHLALLLRLRPQALGLQGIRISGSSRITNRLTEQGVLEFAASGLRLRIKERFRGHLDLSLTDRGPRVTRAGALLDFGKIARVEMELVPAEDGYLTGKVQTQVTLGRASGKANFLWDREGLQAQGDLNYRDQKFDGKVHLEVVSSDRAGKVLGSRIPRRKPFPRPYALVAQGVLRFHFTDWLTGSARVFIDPWGHFTVCGEITPQAEIELFPQKNYRRELPSLEARAAYGIPVLGNVFLFLGIGLELWAVVGPAKFYNLRVSGQYSTDPAVAKDFRIQGSLNISAAAGLDARIEGGAGVEIADHDVKAGIGLTGRAGIKGYAEATPVVGYRENPKNGQGEFFISGDLELGAQPFLGLSGDFFLRVDSPWWSPLGDRKWSWPFMHKEWPLPGTLGIRARVDYVFGSRDWPRIEFGRVDFDPEKFASDLVHRRVKSGPGERKAPGRWKERNRPGARAPSAPEKRPGVRPGGTARRMRVRKKGFPAPGHRARVPGRGRALRKRARRPVRSHGKGIPKGLARKRPKVPGQAPTDPRKARALAAVRAAFAREKKPLPLGRVYALTRKLRRRYRFRRLEAVVRGKRFQIRAALSKERTIYTGPVEEGIPLFGSDPTCPSAYQISGDTLIFRTFYLPRAKYYTQGPGGEYFYRSRYEKRALVARVSAVHPREAKAQRKAWEATYAEPALKSICKFLASKVPSREIKIRSKEGTSSGRTRENICESMKEKNPSLRFLLEEIVKRRWHVFPDWGRKECDKSVSYDVDHIVELAVGGKDDPRKNYVLLTSRANRSSGGAFAAYFRAMRKKATELGKSQVKLVKFSGEPVHPGRGRVGGGDLWTSREIASGEHIKRCYPLLIRRLGAR